MNRGGLLLLVTSRKWGYRYSIPGGHVRKGETVFDAAIREAREEVGLSVKPHRVIAVHEVIYPQQFYSKGRHFIFIDVLCSVKSRDVKVDGDEIQGYVWVKPSEAFSLPLEKYTARLVRQYVRNPVSKRAVFYPADVRRQRRRTRQQR